MAANFAKLPDCAGSSAASGGQDRSQLACPTEYGGCPALQVFASRPRVKRPLIIVGDHRARDSGEGCVRGVIRTDPGAPAAQAPQAAGAPSMSCSRHVLIRPQRPQRGGSRRVNDGLSTVCSTKNSQNDQALTRYQQTSPLLF